MLTVMGGWARLSPHASEASSPSLDACRARDDDGRECVGAPPTRTVRDRRLPDRAVWLSTVGHVVTVSVLHGQSALTARRYLAHLRLGNPGRARLARVIVQPSLHRDTDLMEDLPRGQQLH